MTSKQPSHEPPAVGPLRRLFGRSVLKMLGWRAVGKPAAEPKAVFIAAPHTSNWDAPLMILVAWGLGVRPTWIGKKELFKPPLDRLMRALGGVPVDRSRRQGFVASAAEAFDEADQLYLVISPPGTRRKTDEWKSGFLEIARLANVPLCCAFLDYAKREGGIGPTIQLTGDREVDMERIREFYADITPLRPEQKSAIRLRGTESLVAAQP